MANTNTYPVSSIAFPTAKYNDRYITIEQTKSTLEQGLNVNLIDALSGAHDSKINNYSSCQKLKKIFIYCFNIMITSKSQPIILIILLVFASIL